jgi:hypothetical protein
MSFKGFVFDVPCDRVIYSLFQLEKNKTVFFYRGVGFAKVQEKIDRIGHVTVPGARGIGL